MLRASFAVAAAIWLGIAPARAVDLTLLVGGSMGTVFKEVGAGFARNTGNKLEYVVDTTGALQKRLRSGEAADVILVSAQGMDQLDRDHLIVPGSQTKIAIADIGVSVR